MRKVISGILLSIVMLASTVIPISATSLGVSPCSLNISLVQGGSTSATFLIYYFSGTVSVEAVGIPVTVSPSSFQIDSSPGAIELTLTNSATTTGAYDGYLRFTGADNSNVQLAVQVGVNVAITADLTGGGGVLGGGGGGGGGVAQNPTIRKSPDGLFILSMTYGTEVRASNGIWLSPSDVGINNGAGSPTPPDGYSMVSLVYSFLPDGVTLSPRATLTYHYNPEELPPGTSEPDMVITYYDYDTGEWVILRSIVDMEECTITARVSHFTPFAVLVTSPVADEVIPATPDNPDATVTPTPTEPTSPSSPTKTPAATPSKTPTTPTTKGVPWWIGVVILGAILVVFVIIKSHKGTDEDGDGDADDEVNWDDDDSGEDSDKD